MDKRNERDERVKGMKEMKGKMICRRRRQDEMGNGRRHSQVLKKRSVFILSPVSNRHYTTQLHNFPTIP